MATCPKTRSTWRRRVSTSRATRTTSRETSKPTAPGRRWNRRSEDGREVPMEAAGVGDSSGALAGTVMFYVYQLIDPRDGAVFYVGKGSGDRMFQHVRDAKRGRVSNEAKTRRILDILEGGVEPISRK